MSAKNVLLVLSLRFRSFAFDVLLLGDSVDRHCTYEFCDSHGDGDNCSGPQCTYWCDPGKLPVSQLGRYDKYLSQASARCNVSGHSISYQNNYGSNPRGPYLHSAGSGGLETGNPYFDTPARLSHSIKLFFSRFGSPDLLVLHTTLWDLQLVHEVNGVWNPKNGSFGDVDVRNSRAWNESVLNFETNMNQRFQEVVDQTRSYTNRTLIAARTAAWHNVNGALLDEFNSIVVKIARRWGLAVLDFDAFVWRDNPRTIENEHKLFRDFIHPRRNLTVAWVNHLLNFLSAPKGDYPFVLHNN